jgi:hypothetical protein
VVGRLVLSLDVFVSFDEGKGATLLSLEAEDIEGFSTAMADCGWIGRTLSALYSNPRVQSVMNVTTIA